MITIETYADMSAEEIEDDAVLRIRKTPMGLNPEDFETVMLRIGMNRREFKMLTFNLLEKGRLMFEMSSPEYRNLLGKKRRQMVYIASYNQLKEKPKTINQAEAKNAAIVLRIISVYPIGIRETLLKKLYKSEVKALYGLKEAIAHLISTGKIKRNDQPKTGKIKTIYTAI